MSNQSLVDGMIRHLQCLCFLSVHPSTLAPFASGAYPIRCSQCKRAYPMENQENQGNGEWAMNLSFLPAVLLKGDQWWGISFAFCSHHLSHKSDHTGLCLETKEVNTRACCLHFCRPPRFFLYFNGALTLHSALLNLSNTHPQL